jgi:hypothetical protein
VIACVFSEMKAKSCNTDTVHHSSSKISKQVYTRLKLVVFDQLQEYSGASNITPFTNVGEV